MDYLYFWSERSDHKELGPHVFCQWYYSPFTVDNIVFDTCEHYMMYKKAKHFNDLKSADDVLKTKSPRDVKKIGRRVKNFNNKSWDKVKYKIVVKANLEKFSQSNELKLYLLSTGSECIVEASPFDRIWGIGFDAKNALKNIQHWGENLLGKAIMDVRDILSS